MKASVFALPTLGEPVDVVSDLPKPTIEIRIVVDYAAGLESTPDEVES